jgi:alkyl sulfatase BDS1-like metallo-beta-lactamase superfamily hydrolase
VYEGLGQGSENGTWRNFYLTTALELRSGVGGHVADVTNPEMIVALTTEQSLDSVAIRFDGPRAWGEDLTIDVVLPEEGCRHRLNLHNGALTHRPVDADSPPRAPAGLTLTVSRPQLIGLLAGQGVEEVEHDGDLGLLERLFALTTVPDKRFPIVTP